MIKWKGWIIVLNLALLLGYFFYSINRKEQILKEGKLVLLELAPLDPRSLMQGDYMALRYRISDSVEYNTISKRGYCVVRQDSLGVATWVRFQRQEQPLHAGEQLIEYTMSQRGWVNIGAESFFFQEGQASKYEQANYGGVKIDTKGNSLLVGLYDSTLRKIE